MRNTENNAFKGNTRIYIFQARQLPALLTSIPILLLLNYGRVFLVNNDIFHYFDFVPYLIQTGLSVAALFLQMQLNRFVSKEFFQHTIFKGSHDLPSTRMLLWSDNHFDKSTKTMIHKKIKEFYDMALPNAKAEQDDENEARKRASSAVSQIRNSLRYNAHLNQHNREYGFVRNLVGGSLVASTFSCINIVLAIIMCNTLLIAISIVILGIYMLFVLFGKLLVTRFGQYYADSLFEQFISLEPKEKK